MNRLTRRGEFFDHSVPCRIPFHVAFSAWQPESKIAFLACTNRLVAGWIANIFPLIDGQRSATFAEWNGDASAAGPAALYFDGPAGFSVPGLWDDNILGLVGSREAFPGHDSKFGGRDVGHNRSGLSSRKLLFLYLRVR